MLKKQELEKAKENAEDRSPLVVYKRNGSRTYAIIEFKSLLKLLWRVYE